MEKEPKENKESTVIGEHLRGILENEGIPPSIVQFGGQTAINLAKPLARANLPILGTSAESIDIAEDRARFQNLLEKIGVPQPPGASIYTIEEALSTATIIGYPVLARPSYVLGGRAMELIQNAQELTHYLEEGFELSKGKAILIDKYLEGIEAEVDAVCDGDEVLIPGVMEHVERAGVHSGDSIAVYPPINLNNDEVDTIVDYTHRVSIALSVRGLINIQFVIVRSLSSSEVYVIEANPRASRTTPFISKVTGISMVNLGTRVMLGKKLREMGYKGGLSPKQKLVAVKAPVFSMSKLPGVDTYLGPEMRSTGEVMGIDYTFEAALAKAFLAAGISLPTQGTVLLSLSDRTKPEARPLIQKLADTGYQLFATEGTAAMIQSMRLQVEKVIKSLDKGHPNAIDVLHDGLVNAVINTPEGGQVGTLRDGFYIRRTAVEKGVPCFTSLDTARVAIELMLAKEPKFTVQPLNDYLSTLVSDGDLERTRERSES